MSTVLSNFVTIRKTRGDVLNPTQYATIVSMIRGIVSKYDFRAFNNTYKAFLKHLENFDDPHHDGASSFFDEFISRVYLYYSYMTPSPVTEVEFRENIVTTVGFLELLKRIILNHEMYLSAKLPNGTVPSSFTVRLGEDWGFRPSRDVVIQMGSVTADEASFFRRGWTSPPSPFNPIFTANGLTWSEDQVSYVFYASSMIPPFAVSDDGISPPMSLSSTSNDLIINCTVKGIVGENQSVFLLSNGIDTFQVRYNQANAVTLAINDTAITPAVESKSGWFKIKMSRLGVITLTVLNDGIETVYNYTANFTNVQPFVSIELQQPLVKPFSAAFGIDEISVMRNVPTANFQN